MEKYLYPHFYEIENEHWWFAARQKILFNFVEKIFNFPNHANMLDVGCGTGAILDMFSKKFNCFGQDTSSDAIEFCKKRNLKNVYLGTLNEIELERNTFDLITAFDVLEHIEDEISVLKEMKNLLKDDGRILVTVPAFQFLWGIHDEVTHHKRRYIKPSLKNVIEKSGLKVERISYFNFFLFPIAVLKRFTAKLFNSNSANDLEIPTPILNSILKNIFETEKNILPKINFPFGLSLIAVLKK